MAPGAPVGGHDYPRPRAQCRSPIAIDSQRDPAPPMNYRITGN